MSPRLLFLLSGSKAGRAFALDRDRLDAARAATATAIAFTETMWDREDATFLEVLGWLAWCGGDTWQARVAVAVDGSQ